VCDIAVLLLSPGSLCRGHYHSHGRPDCNPSLGFQPQLCPWFCYSDNVTLATSSGDEEQEIQCTRPTTQPCQPPLTNPQAQGGGMICFHQELGWYDIPNPAEIGYSGITHIRMKSLIIPFILKDPLSSAPQQCSSFLYRSTQTFLLMCCEGHLGSFSMHHLKKKLIQVTQVTESN
jgi:hypothetical protein